MKEKTVFLRRMRCAIFRTALSLCLLLLASSRNADGNDGSRAPVITLDAQQSLGQLDKNPSTPFLRYSPDGRLHAVWTEDHDTPGPQSTPPAQQQHRMDDRAPSLLKNQLHVAWTESDGEDSRAIVRSATVVK